MNSYPHRWNLWWVKTFANFATISERFLRKIFVLVSPCVGGSKVPPRTLYRIKCVLAEILYGCQKQNGGFYVAREKLLREACKHL